MKNKVFMIFSAACILAGCTNAPAEQKVPAPETAEPTSAPVVTEQTVQEDVEGIRALLKDKGYNAGIVYLGMADTTAAIEELAKDYPYLSKAQIVEQDGSQIFGFIATDPNAEVTVEQWGIENYDEGPKMDDGEDLLEVRNGGPIILKGFVSDMIPNMSISVESHDVDIIEDYTPMLSGKDGSVELGTPDMKIMDLTK